MKKYLSLLVLLWVSISVEAVNDDWRVIKNELYSLELPSGWIPQQGMPGNGCAPGTRKVKPYIIYYFAWHSPIKDKNDFPHCVGIDIQTYEKLDASTVSLDEAKK
ncbi:MAG: hypothetical protein LUE99_00710 [Bacteroides sp.]|nr:hypothetical protein [Bacteroides sp.]